MQKNIWINDVQVPVIVEGGEKWYPINYVFEKVLEIKTSKKQLEKLEDTKLFIKMYTLDMNFLKAGKQNTYCIKERGLKTYLTEHIKIGRYSVWQRKLLNGLLEYLGLDSVSEQEQFLNKFNYKGNYNVFVEDCIEFVLKENPKIKWQKCSRCDNYFPYHKNFFKENLHSSKDLNTVCRECNGGYFIKDKVKASLGKIFTKKGEEYYEYYENHDTILLYQCCVKEGYKLPPIINNKNDYEILLKWLYKTNVITKDNLTHSLLLKKLKININQVGLKMDDVYGILFNNHWREYPWKYPNVQLSNLTMDEAKNIFKNYLEENNIIIDDVYEFDYTLYMKKSKITQFMDNYMDFVVQYYDYKYPAYKFKNSGTNYYKIKEARIRDLKYFIEEDMKIDINKIPMYLTKMSLQRNARTLYMLLHGGKYYKNLFEWVDECYPGMYVEADFVINPYRDEFDSLEEMEIHNLLKDNFACVIYNQRNTGRTIKVKGMIPDWIVFTDEYCILIEYFGLWLDRGNLPKRNKEYMDKVVNKIGKYNTLSGYKFIDLYPRDLENDFEGVKNKIHIYLESK